MSKFATGASGPLLLSGDGIVAMGALAAFVRWTFYREREREGGRGREREAYVESTHVLCAECAVRVTGRASRMRWPGC